MKDRLARAHEKAGGQLGLLSYDQLLDLGFDKHAIHRLVASGRWKRVFPRVLQLWKADDEWRQRVVAASLWAGDHGTISHMCAAVWWEFDACTRGVPEVTLASARKPPEGIKVHRATLASAERGRSGCIWVTTPVRTLIDISSGLDVATLEMAVHSAMRQRRCSLERLRSSIDRSRGRNGVGRLRGLVDDLGLNGATESPLETRFIQLIRRHRLPPPIRQYSVMAGDQVIARVDFAYPEYRVAIEIDGFRYHSSPADLRRDHRRLNMLRAAGWSIIFVSADDLRSPGDLLADLCELLGRPRLRV